MQIDADIIKIIFTLTCNGIMALAAKPNKLGMISGIAEGLGDSVSWKPNLWKKLRHAYNKSFEEAFVFASKQGIVELEDNCKQTILDGCLSPDFIEILLASAQPKSILADRICTLFDEWQDQNPVQDAEPLSGADIEWGRFTEQVIALLANRWENDNELREFQSHIQIDKLARSTQEMQSQLTKIHDNTDGIPIIGTKVDAILTVTQETNKKLQTMQLENLPKWLTLIPRQPSDKFVPRPEVNNLISAAKEHSKIAVFGWGGLGKTEIVINALECIKDEWAHLAWVTYGEDGLVKSMLDKFDSFVKDEKKDDEQNFNSLLAWLNSLGKSLLLIVDNIDANIDKDPDLQQLEHLSCTVIVSSRQEVFVRFAPIPVGLLSPEKAYELFEKYYAAVPNDEKTAVKEIVQLAGQHTLTLEIIAKTACKRKMLPSEILADLHDNGFNLAIKVGTAWNADSQAIMMEQLEKLFRIANIDTNPRYMHIVRSFSLFPYLPLARQDVCNLLELSIDTEQALYDLADLGWLERSSTGFAMHPVVREVVQHGAPPQEQVLKFLLSNFIRVIIENDVFSYRKWLPFFWEVCKRCEGKTPLVAASYNYLSVIYRAMSDLPEALVWQKKDIEICEHLYPDGMHSELATSYNNLSLIYQDMSNLPEALVWQKKAIDIKEHLYPDGMHSELATSYHNLAATYYSVLKFPEALDLELESLCIFRTVLGDKHPNTDIAMGALCKYYIKSGYDATKFEEWLAEKYAEWQEDKGL